MMINIDEYRKRLDAVSKAQSDKSTIAAFAANGGRYKLAISGPANEPAIAIINALMTADHDFAGLLRIMETRAQTALTNAENDMINIAAGEAIQKGMGE
jgi:hypothetical protein